VRLEFNILWFENQPDDIATTITEIKEYIEEVGFRSGINLQTDTSHLEALSQQQEAFNEFDLVLVDWDLGIPEIQGDEVARRVRARFGFTDIIFYSGKAPANLRAMVHKLGIDGVYCMPRTQLVASLVEHIDEVVKRLSRLEAMRGIAVGTVGKCDEDFKQILTELYMQTDAEGRSAIEQRLDELVSSGAANSAKKYGKCADFHARLASRAVTSFHLQKLTLEMTKGREDVRSYRSILGRYDQEVLGPRNVLGHAVERRAKNGWEVTSGGDTPITREDFPALRASFARHLDNLKGLRTFVTEGASETE